MRPEQELETSASRPNSNRGVPDGSPRRCNCGRHSPRLETPLLTGDLVIAARDRAREPELPEATVARALSTPIAPRLARYDVILVSNGNGDDERDARIAAEFARHEHRVFHLGNHSRGGEQSAAPALKRIEREARR